MLTNYNGTNITYDTIGNPFNWRNGMSFTWSNGRRLTSVTKGTNNYSYTYDADGLRTSKTVNGVTTNYYYAEGTLLAQKTGNDTLRFLYDNSGTAYGFSYNRTLYYYQYNLQGDVVGIYDNTGTKVVSYDYSVWGEVLSVTGTLASTIGQLNPIRYRGYYYDTETGFYYLKSRYYDPEMCRFINADAYVSTGQGIVGHNMFAYCGNNPINYFDPKGCAKEKVWERLGFVYDGSMRDFMRLNQGLPPYSYEEWLATGGTKKVDKIETQEYGVTVTLKTATYIPADSTKDYYIEKAKNLTSLNISDIALFTTSIAVGKFVPHLSIAVLAIEAITILNTYSQKADLAMYEAQMNKNEGVLIIEWEVKGRNVVNSIVTKYASWSGEGDPFEY